MKQKIDNNLFIAAVLKLKGDGKIKRDAEIADALEYAPGTVSEYVNNKKPVSKTFLKLFALKYGFELSSLLPKDITTTNEPQANYGTKKNTDFEPRADYVMIAVLEKSLREQVEQTKIQMENRDILRLLAEQFLSGIYKKQLEGVSLKFTSSVKQSKKQNH